MNPVHAAWYPPAIAVPGWTTSEGGVVELGTTGGGTFDDPLRLSAN
jgi:hypothetical protein